MPSFELETWHSSLVAGSRHKSFKRQLFMREPLHVAVFTQLFEAMLAVLQTTAALSDILQ